ncbi:metallophosphoesterase [Deinococcus ruber]|uniref:Metallophosphoesterase n=1 Tax=Deinococcus ruber TaxID=1848197 RepID=A0A918CKP9_9DEIO|nr:metallophosphoesterase [Deinococcus ruber]GGR28873.1 putative metallophosphoesterase [Deinococcus ruber]
MSEPSPRFTRRTVLTLGAGMGLLGTVSGTAQAYAAATLNRQRTELAGLNTPLRVAVLADLHYGPYIRAAQVRGWVDLTRSLRPDLILLPGDFTDERLGQGMPDALLHELSRLSAPLGVYGVWGNHDYGSFGLYHRRFHGEPREDWETVRETFQAALATAGVTVLTNAGRQLRPDVYLGGVDDLWWGLPDAGPALAGAAPASAQLLMSHNPDYLMDLPRTASWRSGGLVVSGHTHGGQIRLPVLGALKVPSQYGQRFAKGWVQGDPAGKRPGARGFVSRGLGVSGVPFRNLCPPEVVLLELEPERV